MTTPKVSAPEWASGQASPDATMNEMGRRIEAGAGFYIVVDKDLTTPPGSCADGATYIVAGGGGAWAGHIGDLAISVGVDAVSGWYFRDPEEGVFAWVQDEDVLYRATTATSPATWTTYSASPGSIALDDLSDVDTISASHGDALIYDTNSPTGWKARGPTECLIVAVGDETTAITAGTSKVTFRMPYAFKLETVKGSLSTAQTSGGQVIVDLNEAGASILSTKVLFDNGSKTSVGSSPQPVISDADLADDAEMTIDVDNVGDGTAKGLKLTLIGYRK